MRYDYKCRSCEHVFEVEHRMSESFGGPCPSCGWSDVVKKISPPRFEFVAHKKRTGIRNNKLIGGDPHIKMGFRDGYKGALGQYVSTKREAERIAAERGIELTYSPDEFWPEDSEATNDRT